VPTQHIVVGADLCGKLGKGILVKCMDGLDDIMLIGICFKGAQSIVHRVANFSEGNALGR
jgi:hypothetical protein